MNERKAVLYIHGKATAYPAVYATGKQLGHVRGDKASWWLRIGDGWRQVRHTTTRGHHIIHGGKRWTVRIPI